MNPTERKMKTRSESYWSRSMAELLDRSNDLIREHPHLTLDLIEVTTVEEYGDTNIGLEYETPETDAEVKYRLDWEANIEKNRRRQYEEMKKEFEGGSKA